MAVTVENPVSKVYSIGLQLLRIKSEKETTPCPEAKHWLQTRRSMPESL